MELAEECRYLTRSSYLGRERLRSLGEFKKENREKWRFLASIPTSSVHTQAIQHALVSQSLTGTRTHALHILMVGTDGMGICKRHRQKMRRNKVRWKLLCMYLASSVISMAFLR